MQESHAFLMSERTDVYMVSAITSMNAVITYLLTLFKFSMDI